MANQEPSESGIPIFNYQNKDKNDFTPAFGNEETVDAMSNHIETNIGQIASVFHEIVSDLVHIDVYWVKPTEKLPYNILITSGMSDLPMNEPAEVQNCQFAELCILLPSNWVLEGDDKSKNVLEDENNYWPLRWLKIIARFPHEYNTWISTGHTIPNGENADPFAPNTNLGCMLLLQSVTLSEKFSSLKITEHKIIHFYCLLPIYKEEMKFRLKNGTEALLDKFDKSKISDIVKLDRKNTCAKTGFMGLW